MKSYLSKEETEELESLKQDLVGPVRSFLAEVREDTVGDAKRYYSARARKAQQDVKLDNMAKKITEKKPLFGRPLRFKKGWCDKGTKIYWNQKRERVK